MKQQDYLKTTVDFNNFRKKFVDNCPLCHFSGFKQIYTVRDLNYIRCKKCRFIFVNPQPIDRDLKRMYDRGLKRWSNISTYKQSRKLQFLFFLDVIDKFTDRNKGLLLDVGCGIGYFMELAKKAGWDVEGIDISASDIKIAKKKGFKVYQRNLEKFPIKDSHYSVITLLDTIEHLPNPVLMLDSIKRILKPNGLVLVHTGNVGDIGRCFAGSQNPFVKSEGHISLFSKKTLKMALEKVGLKILLSIDENDYYRWLLKKGLMDKEKFTPSLLIKKTKRLFCSAPDIYILATKKYKFQNEK